MQFYINKLIVILTEVKHCDCLEWHGAVSHSSQLRSGKFFSSCSAAGRTQSGWNIRAAEKESQIRKKKVNM